MRLKISGFPYLPNLPGGDAGISGHETHTPMSCLMGNPLNGQTQNLFDLLFRKLFGLTGAGQI